MRPIRLVMSAFGPYAKLQEIDFSRLNEQIFVISGPTGAGKTTIFDAISYALFGEASGSSRDKDSLRSDFAAPETETFVELEFILRGEHYTIKRSPQQQQKKQRGEGFTTKNADAQLEMPDGQIITRISAVDDKITELMGINKSQFKQIVMLPQGEFRKLLEAESNERELIFRKIFGTEAYALIQQKLDYKKKDLARAIHDLKLQLMTHVKHVECGQNETLSKLQADNYINVQMFLELLEAQCKQEEGELADQKLKLSQLQKLQSEKKEQLIKYTEINRQFEEVKQLQSEQVEQESRKSEYDAKQSELDYAQKALLVVEIDESVEALKVAIKAKTEQLVLAQQEKQQKQQELVDKEQLLEKAKEAEPHIKQLEIEHARLKGMIAKVADYEKNTLLYKEYGTKLSTLSEKLSKCHKDLEASKNNKKQLELDLKNILLQEKDFERQEGEIQQIKNSVDSLAGVRQLAKRQLEFLNSFEQKQSEFNSFEQLFIQKRTDYLDIEDSYLKGQAGLLSKGLKTGTPCPVCGSTEHPMPAKVSQSMPDEHQLKAVKAELDKLASDRTALLNELSVIKGNIESNEAELLTKSEQLSGTAQLSISEQLLEIKQSSVNKQVYEAEPPSAKERLNQQAQPISGLKSEQLRNVVDIKAFEIAVIDKGTLLCNIIRDKQEQQKVKRASIIKRPEIEQRLQQQESIAKRLEDDIKDGQQQEVRYSQEFARLKEWLQGVNADIPEEIRTTAKLNMRLNAIGEQISALEKQKKDAQQAFDFAKEQLNAATLNVATREEALKNASEDLIRSTNRLGELLKQAGFADYLQYRECRRSQQSIETLKAEINKYNERANELKTLINKLQEQTMGKSYVNITEKQQELESIELQVNTVQDTQTLIVSRLMNNKKILSSIKQVNSQLEKQEAQQKTIVHMANIANGDNAEKVTFERYVLAAYFDEIITAANLRLERMTGSRYQLKRKEERGKGRAQQGLELEVFDNYTGKSRHVKTLSGGEGFKASLSLALGLADVVQAYSGGISLDTLFVDEGFGTLDPESLESAINCLIDLQKSGRLVGVISHVAEIKERIRNVLQITAEKEGSFAEFIV